MLYTWLISVFWHQQMLGVCLNFRICNDIIFNPVKSVCIAFQPKKRKLFCPNVTLDNNVLEQSRTKYLGLCLTQMRKMTKIYAETNA